MGQLYTLATLLLVNIREEPAWTPEPVWTLWTRQICFMPHWERNCDCVIAGAIAKSLSCLLLYIIILQKVRETSWVQHGYSAGNSTVILTFR